MFVLNVYQDKVRLTTDGRDVVKRAKAGGLFFDNLADAKEVENALFEHSKRTSTELCIRVPTMTGMLLVPVDAIEEVHSRYTAQLDAYTSKRPAKSTGDDGHTMFFPPSEVRKSRKALKRWFIQKHGHLPNDWRDYLDADAPLDFSEPAAE